MQKKTALDERDFSVLEQMSQLNKSVVVDEHSRKMEDMEKEMERKQKELSRMVKEIQMKEKEANEIMNQSIDDLKDVEDSCEY